VDRKRAIRSAQTGIFRLVFYLCDDIGDTLYIHIGDKNFNLAGATLVVVPRHMVSRPYTFFGYPVYINKCTNFNES